MENNCYTEMTDAELIETLEKLKTYRDDPNNSVMRDIFMNHISEVVSEIEKRQLLLQ